MSFDNVLDPVSLAAPIAEHQFFSDTSFEGSVYGDRNLVELDRIADAAGLWGGGLSVLPAAP